MHSFIPSAIRRYRNQRHLTLENVSGIAGMSVQHLSEIESSKRDPRLSSIERIADAMELAVLLVIYERNAVWRKTASRTGATSSMRPNVKTSRETSVR